MGAASSSGCAITDAFCDFRDGQFIAPEQVLRYQRRAGLIVNVTSSATLAPFPLVSAYIASKTAVEGFTASLAHERKAIDVRVKLVEPGYGPSTNFTANDSSACRG